MYRLVAESPEERDDWIRCIDATVRHSEVYDSVNERRKRITGIQGLDIPELN